MLNPLEVLREAAPIRVPVKPESYDVFFRTLIRYLDQPDIVRIVYDVFGPDTTARFISVFHGMTLQLKPRDFWVANFQTVSTYLELEGLEEGERTRKAEWISARTGVPVRNILQMHADVKQKLRQHS